ncbi:ThuA domain-containing protein [Flavivirga abyssicola]|uniref:ThuA domain-containing protein n=1 Tax=Flavivirga abyssicola TaxID=3063533 RepID=UPI0026DF47F9|nr:ThuA domain-containing protein [Flavivirga sp. MEBiC07777]WVK12240.1 ThuA domain-containing protein [Flavivirga sp. MEBiC07777]
MVKLFFQSAIFLFWGHIMFAHSYTDKLNVLIVDGFSNHDWKQTSLIVKTILEKSNLFEVDISTAPSEPEDIAWENWRPKFKDYDVVIQNTNNIHNKKIQWPRVVQKEMEEYLRSGGGLYILHSANNAFPDWEAYNLMIGLGWRSKEAGVALQINEGEEVIRIPVGKGKSTYHGPRNDEIIYTLNDHSINKDFPKKWKTPNMELYKYARGPAKNMTMLSYAKDKETNINWPVEWVISYGKGRVYNSSMGHLWKGDIYPLSYRCVGFQTTLIRAAEWLATGKVSYKVPNNFPSEHSIELVDLEVDAKN